MDNVQSTINRLFVATDQQDWQAVQQCFGEKVMLDYSSMTGSPASETTPQQIMENWGSVLPGFAHTHHQLGNFIINEEENKATVFCYGTATHYLEDQGGNVWTVVGSYDFNLEKQNGDWKITSMTFNFKYQDGNKTLIQKAIENAKQ